MMKRLLVGFWVLSLTAAHGRQISDVLSLSPAHPRIGQQIAVTYHGGAAAAQLKQADSMEVQVLIYRNCVHEYDNEPARIDAALHRDGEQWTGSFALGDPMAKYLLLRVASGDARDDNGGKCWDALVYGEDGSPVRGAYLQRGTYRAGWGYFYFTSPKEVSDPAGAKADLESEIGLYPDSWHAAVDLWEVDRKDETDTAAAAALRAGLQRLRAAYSSNETAAFRIYNDYLHLGDSSEALRLRQQMTLQDPKGDFVRRAKWGDITGPGSESGRLELMEDYFKEFTNLGEAERRVRLRSYFSACLSKKEYDRAYDVLTRMQTKDGSMYNDLTWPMVDKGVELEKAVAWAKKGVDLSRNPDPSARPLSVSEQAWLRSRGENLGMVLDTYGYGLLQLGRNAEAVKSFEEAYRLLEGKDPDVNGRYVQSLVANGAYAAAVKVGTACVKSGTDSPALIAGVKKALVAEDGTATSYEALNSEEKVRFEALVADANRAREEEVRKKVLASRISSPSVDFTLKDLRGNPVTLSSLKGSVVVIDFWATWCGPCKSSFPYFQSVYDKYKGNDHVVFLAVDTWEREKDLDATVANAKKFMESNKYTFPVLIDALSGKKVVDAYGVDGIPTKFIVDKKGNIAFKSVGFEGSGMEIELTQQIEAALADPPN